MAALAVVLLLLACSVQLSSSTQVPRETVQELYGVASSYPECTNIYWRKLRYARGIVLVLRSACRKDEGTFRSAMNNLQCSDITTAVSRYCSRKYSRFWATNLVCQFARKVNERCEDRSPFCKLAISRLSQTGAGITCEGYERYCKSSSYRSRYFFRSVCRLTEQFYSQCCGDNPMTEPTTTPAPVTTTLGVSTTEPPTTTPTTTEVPMTDPTTTTPEPTTTTPEVTTTEQPTTQPASTTPGSTLPEVADKTFLTACQQQCVRNDLVGSLCTQETLPQVSCNNLEPPATDGSYTCCQG
ncbi:uncharacterized protein [Haliotis asinina]|uniref:uncharacterized protein n=1 Tax=Haliotis asinina TaxID=109174 RepID=UPI0035320CD6